jgi:predicted metal-dependent phosphoesterase TrpH
MRIRGALHVHSILSHDGTMTIAEVAAWYKDRGYQFVAMGEHSQDMDDLKVRELIGQSERASSAQFCVVPGIEYACRGGLHIVGIGVTSLIPYFEPVPVIDSIHEHGGYAVLAHPTRKGTKVPGEVLGKIDAAEIWNIGNDGKFLPSSRSLKCFRNMRQMNPRLLAVAGHDFHRKAGFYDVAIEMDVAFLSSAAVLQNLRAGRYSIRARLFRCNADRDLTWFESARFFLLSWQIGMLRGARDVLLRRS